LITFLLKIKLIFIITLKWTAIQIQTNRSESYSKRVSFTTVFRFANQRGTWVRGQVRVTDHWSSAVSTCLKAYLDHS